MTPTPEPTAPQLRCPACGGPHLPLMTCPICAVEQVRRETREQVAREIEADRPKHADSCRCGGCTRLRKDARIARAAEAVDPRGE